jgi:tripartite-type tricarboxylate transporter receptor subunit TctC
MRCFSLHSDLLADTVEKLGRGINTNLADSKMKVRLAELGVTVSANPSNSFRAFISEETAKWAKVLRAANIRASEPTTGQPRYSVTSNT